MNILTAKLTIEGTRPLLWNAFTPAAIPLEKREKTGVAGNDPDEWRRTVLVTDEGRLYLEPTYAFGCLRDGAKYTRRGRSSLQPLVAATLQINTPRLLINRYLPAELTTDPTQPVYLDVRSVRNPSTRARNVRYRVAAAPGWTTSFDIIFDATIVSRQEMEAITIDAGRLVGMGDGRAIGFGRFRLVEFSVIE